MTESNKGSGVRDSISRVTIVASIFVIFLALGAMFWPRSSELPHRDVLLVLDPAADSLRIQEFYLPLMSLLSWSDGHGLHLEVTNNIVDFQLRAERGARYLVAPDHVALGFDVDRYLPLVTGRRAAPQNLRPRGALVYRKIKGVGVKFWQESFANVIVGDSLSLVIIENLEQKPGALGAVGPDPYNHGPVLHALRLASFDYALVNQWDALRFFDSGLLSSDEWGMELLGEAWPGLVLLADGTMPAQGRVKTAEILSNLGRESGKAREIEGRLLNGLKGVNLVGFNLLLEPDFENVRKRAKENWPPKGN